MPRARCALAMTLHKGGAVQARRVVQEADPYGRVIGGAVPGVRKKPGRADVGIGPYGSATRGAMGGRPQGSPLHRARRRAEGSELSAAGGRGSEVSEWPRSKFPASAVRQRRNFGHRNRIIGPYGVFTDRIL